MSKLLTADNILLSEGVKQMKMIKKVALTAAMALVASAVFAEVSVDGFFRTEVSNNIYSPDTGDGESFFSATEGTSGYYFGLGGERLRVNTSISNEDGTAGVKFRYQADAGIFFTSSNVKYAMAHIKLFDGLFDVEAGKLTDGYTGTNGYNGYGFDGVRGARLVVLPIEGLAVTAQVAGDDGTYSKDYVSFSASYANDAFNVQGGYKLDGTAYYGFQLTAVDGLNLVVDGTFADKDASGETNKDGDKVIKLTADVTAEYSIAPVTFGVAAELSFVEDANLYYINPFVSFDLADFVTPGLSAAVEFGYVVADAPTDPAVRIFGFLGGVDDGAMKITPSVTYVVGDVTLQGYYTFSKLSSDADNSFHSIGMGIKYAF